MQKLDLYLVLLLTFLFAFTNCSDSTKITGKGCVFIQNDDDEDGIIDDTERTLMDDCLQDAFTTREEIEANLTGEWELVGHAEGWTFKVSQPCSYLTFSGSTVEVSYTNAFIDTTFTSNWELKTAEQEEPYNHTFEFGGEVNFFFSFNIFCEDYMYFDHTPLDGNMAIYEKVN